VAVRERIRQAIQAPVDRAEATLAEAPDADATSRLLIFLNGWFQGISAGLEEIAIELDSLRGRDLAEPATSSPPDARAGTDDAAESPAPKPAPADAEHDAAPQVDEEALIALARKSRDETGQLRQERDDTIDEPGSRPTA
jgi:hypothetical protein